METCPCNPSKPFATCCEPYLLGQSIPETPETLMRSRYTAYTLANIDYIGKTMSGKMLRTFNPKDAKQWALSSEWQSLEIVEAPAVVGNLGFVSFIVRYIAENTPQSIHETSEFHKIENRWYYVKEHPFKNVQQQVTNTAPCGRNDPCSCGSTKKFKKCCGAA